MKLREYFENSDFDEVNLCEEDGENFKLVKKKDGIVMIQYNY